MMRRSKRLYKSGSRFALWRWSFTPSGYLTRLFLLHTPLGGAMLHWINGPDPEPDPHDHPVTFLSIFLRGWYTEAVYRKYNYILGTPNSERIKCLHYPTWFNFIRAGKHIHRIIRVQPGTLTLAFYGPKRCEWGFYTPDGKIGWREYNRKYKKEMG